MKKAKHWYDYLWIVTPVYLALGFFNILFAWLGMIFFCLPLDVYKRQAASLHRTCRKV